MLGTIIIVFREVLEAALIVSIVLAASKGAPGRDRWVSGGVAAGILGAGVVATFAGAIAAAVSGIGQNCSTRRSCSSRSACSAGTSSGCLVMAASSRPRRGRL